MGFQVAVSICASGSNRSDFRYYLCKLRRDLPAGGDAHRAEPA
jgi:hypothetical protein